MQEIAILVSIIKYKNKLKRIKYAPVNHFLSNKSLLCQEKPSPEKKKFMYNMSIRKPSGAKKITRHTSLSRAVFLEVVIKTKLSFLNQVL